MNVAPPTRLERILNCLERASDPGDLQSVIVELRGHFRIDHLVYHWVSADGDQYGCGTYPPEWVSRYLQNDYLRIDPVVLGCYQRFHPVEWKRLDWSGKAVRAFAEDARAHGIGAQGFSVPLRGPNGQFALFTANHDCDDDTWRDFTQSHCRELILIAHDFNRKALEFEPERAEAGNTLSLSPREVDALTLLALGYGRAQVAETLSISEHTLRVYIESARFKLGAINTVHAVARALSRGLIFV
ncbi:helix-turn-helix transcriptional regulator [Roseovarius indicus]|uniref:helix-turn-helix transcriptional regulator n=1 Tax=Roseovarius indicus TaxID=540747 RepID=UPI0007DA3835|nr:autoinducer binding domain-containing protein [Roseovarius indicus]OAO06004.1 LuxR family transcriptional regulator [Roseovarius indicus]